MEKEQLGVLKQLLSLVILLQLLGFFPLLLYLMYSRCYYNSSTCTYMHEICESHTIHYSVYLLPVGCTDGLHFGSLQFHLLQ